LASVRISPTRELLGEHGEEEVRLGKNEGQTSSSNVFKAKCSTYTTAMLQNEGTSHEEITHSTPAKLKQGTSFFT
jgi:hypothetical protein